MKKQSRAFLMLFGLLCFCYVGATEKIHDVKVQVYWELPPSRMKEAEKLLVPGLELSERGKGERVAPIVIIAGAVALAYIVRAAIEIYRDAKYGGVVLSVKDDRLRIENDVRLPSGIVVVRNKDNVQVFSTSRQNEGEILAKLAPLLQTK